MENQVQEAISSVPAREIGVITSEIKDICRQAQSMELMYAVEVGRRLTEAKALLPHGKWGEWLENEVNFSERSAQRLMKVFAEYGSSQLSFFVSNPTTLSHLSFSKALALLAVPEEEREAFAEEVKAEDLSVRELQEAIKERDEAKKQLKKVTDERDRLRIDLEDHENASKVYADQAREASIAKDEIQLKYSDSEKKRKELAKKLKDAKENPNIPPEVLDKARQELEESIRKEMEVSTAQALSEVEEKLKEADKRVEAAEGAQKQVEQEKQQIEGTIQDLQKKLKLANPEVTEFKTLFNAMQETYGKLCTLYVSIYHDFPDIAFGLHSAMRSFADSILQRFVS